MKATITFTDNGDQVDVNIEFEPELNQESAAHHLAVDALKAVACIVGKSTEGDE